MFASLSNQRGSFTVGGKRLGDPKATRAVGRANGRNPVAILVPCHRVVGSDGKLTGYAGGLPRKRWLLDHEARFVPLRLSPPVAR